ncbi:hypothetical protein SISSUDRAFT_1068228 [Sistotremastrum suecicum HHB10207 ss-3]|uniref:Uncharacterized protein n=1 Tax=Sistotremastrum suecicum HHB10207 ss-3 TaxID=1314776 RepID=A0A165WDE1_9AGAM|nr:hypothetical protein SISSUDRAFT_1068228 [Sistotremastrum suecicum HHB10207 ss-3]
MPDSFNFNFRPPLSFLARPPTPSISLLVSIVRGSFALHLPTPPPPPLFKKKRIIKKTKRVIKKKKRVIKKNKKKKTGCLVLSPNKEFA